MIDRKKALHLLSKVGPERAFQASILVRPRGAHLWLVTSIPDLVLLLSPSTNHLPGVNFPELENWVRDVVGDQNLARRIAQTEDLEYSDRCIAVNEIVKEQVSCYMAIARGAEDATAGSSLGQG